MLNYARHGVEGVQGQIEEKGYTISQKKPEVEQKSRPKSRAATKAALKKY